MPAPKFIDIDGTRLRLAELLQRRREQVAAATKVEQPAPFELKADCRRGRGFGLRRSLTMGPARKGRGPSFAARRISSGIS